MTAMDAKYICLKIQSLLLVFHDCIPHGIVSINKDVIVTTSIDHNPNGTATKTYLAPCFLQCFRTDLSVFISIHHFPSFLPLPTTPFSLAYAFWCCFIPPPPFLAVQGSGECCR